MALIADGVESTMDNIFKDMKSEFSSVSTFNLDKTTSTGGYAFSLERDRDTYCIGYTEGEHIWHAAGWDLGTLTTDNSGNNLSWNTNEFWSRDAYDSQNKGSQNCVYYLGTGTGYAWCVFHPIDDLDGTSSYQDPMVFGVAEVTKLWDWYPEFECLQNVLMAGGSSGHWDRGSHRAWSPIRQINNGSSSPDNDSTVSVYQTGSLTSANSWVGTEKNIVMSDGISGINDGVKMGTFEGWAYDHQYDNSDGTVPSGTKIEIDGVSKTFIYLDPANGISYGPNLFQYSS